MQRTPRPRSLTAGLLDTLAAAPCPQDCPGHHGQPLPASGAEAIHALLCCSVPIIHPPPAHLSPTYLLACQLSLHLPIVHLPATYRVPPLTPSLAVTRPRASVRSAFLFVGKRSRSGVAATAGSLEAPFPSEEMARRGLLRPAGREDVQTGLTSLTQKHALRPGVAGA